jgi:hypothetical protein
MIMLYMGLVGSILENGSVCYSGMARTNMLRLERVMYRGIRIALGHMCSTSNNSLEVLSGKAPLAERFVYLNFIYLVVVFYRIDHPLELNLDRCIAGYFEVLPLNIALAESFTRHDLPALLGSQITWKRHFPGFRHLSIRWWLPDNC